MAAKAHVWPATRDEVLALLEPVLRESRSLAEAATRFDKSEGSLYGLCRAHKIKYRDFLRTSRPTPSPTPDPPLGTMVPEPEQAPAEVDWTGSRSTSVNFERRVILGDLHVPYHDLGACAVALAIVRALQPHTVVQLGDFYNMGAVSHHPRPFGGRENHSRSVAMGKGFLHALRRAAPGATIHLLMGNHDDWGMEYEDENPQFAGLFSANQALDAQALALRVHGRHAQPLVLGPVAYRHGYGGGTHFAQRYALDDGPRTGVKCLVVAHHHTIQRFHAKNGVECWGAGWLGTVGSSGAFDYAKNPHNWERGLLVQDVAGDMVTTYPIKFYGRSALVFGRVITG